MGCLSFFVPDSLSLDRYLPPFHTAGDIGLDFLQRDAESDGQLAMEKPLCLLHIPLIHHAKPSVLSFRLTAFGINGHHELYQLFAVAGPHGGLIVLGQGLQSGPPEDLGLDGGDQVDECFCLLRRNHRPHRHLGILHRCVDDAVLVEGLEQIVGLVSAET